MAVILCVYLAESMLSVFLRDQLALYVLVVTVLVVGVGEFFFRLWNFMRRKSGAQQQIEDIIDNVREAVFVIDAQQRIVRFNMGAERIFGYRLDEVQGQAMRLLLPEGMSAIERVRLAKRPTGPRDTTVRAKPFFTLKGRRKSGELFDAEISISNADNRTFVIIARDVAEAKFMTDALRDSEELYHQLVELSPDAIVTHSGGKITFINHAGARMFGAQSPEAMLELPIQSLMTPHEQTLERAQRTLYGKALFFEETARRIDGSEFAAEMGGVSFSYRGQRTSLMVIRDITARKEAQAALREAEALRIQLEKDRELVELRHRIITMVSHELRTPLTMIMTASEILERYHERESAEKRLERIRQIQKQAYYMTSLIQDVMIYTKAEARTERFDPQPMDLQVTCQEIFDKFQLMDAGQHRNRFAVSGTFTDAQMDEKLLEHILMNLLTNASQYSPPNTEILLSLRRESDEAVLQVIDEGIGIPPADLPRIFEPFHRAKNVGTVSGTGLGLAIVKSHVELHGGTISCESRENEGTIFTVRLPIIPRT
jgi:PAS domain S-box-containing protein